MTTWFTSDWHIGHEAIISFCKRPYRSVDEMNLTILRTFNDIVKPGDTTYFLGDFSFCDPRPWVQQMNGEKFLIAGNHDQKRMSGHKKAGWGWIKDVYELKTERCPIWLSHYPHRSWPGSYWGSVHLYGHTHGLAPDQSRSMDVGLDAQRRYVPISLESIWDKYEKEPFVQGQTQEY